MGLRVGEIVKQRHVLSAAFAEQPAEDEFKAASEQGTQLAQANPEAGNKQSQSGQNRNTGNKSQNSNSNGKTGQEGENNASSSPIGDINLDDASKKKLPGPANGGVQYSDQRMKLYKDLAQRRKELEKRAEKLRKRKALLKAAEKELEKKYTELKKLRNEIQALLKEQSKQKEQRISSLVKIYSGMKADDAARIFNTLEMSVLVEVMSRMSERNLAPILAEMNAEKARKVTMLLAEEKDLPSMPQKLNN